MHFHFSMIKKSKSQNTAPVISSKKEETILLDDTLRPKKLAEYIGQEHVKNNLEIYIKAAQKRKQPLEHMLFYGPPGLGKTTLSHIIAYEMNSMLKITSGPALEKQADLAAILTNIKAGDVLFIDEIHRLRSNVEEILYSAMEDYALDIMIGKGPSARSMRIDIPQFTLIGATTKVSMVSAPLRDRFGSVIKLDFYTPSDLQTILKRSSSILQCSIDEKAALKIAERSRGTPRVANQLLKRIRDFAEILHEGDITEAVAHTSLGKLKIDHLGLNEHDIELLKTLIEKFDGGPVGVSTLAASLSEDQDTIEDVYEPYLLQIGFIERTPRGRKATKKAYQHIGLQDTRLQQSLL